MTLAERYHLIQSPYRPRIVEGKASDIPATDRSKKWNIELNFSAMKVYSRMEFHGDWILASNYIRTEKTKYNKSQKIMRREKVGGEWVYLWTGRYKSYFVVRTVFEQLPGKLPPGFYVFQLDHNKLPDYFSDKDGDDYEIDTSRYTAIAV